MFYFHGFKCKDDGSASLMTTMAIAISHLGTDLTIPRPNDNIVFL